MHVSYIEIKNKSMKVLRQMSRQKKLDLMGTLNEKILLFLKVNNCKGTLNNRDDGFRAGSH